MVPARNRWLYPVSPRVVWCGWFYYTIKQNRGRPISQPRNEQERGREGAVFNPYPVPTPRSIWPFNFLRPLNLLFSPPCLCLLEARRNSILGIGRPCPFPVLVTDLSLCNPCTFLISWTILPKKKREKKKNVSPSCGDSIIRYQSCLCEGIRLIRCTPRENYNSRTPFLFFSATLPGHVSRESRATRGIGIHFEHGDPVSFVSITFYSLESNISLSLSLPFSLFLSHRERIRNARRNTRRDTDKWNYNLNYNLLS